MDYLSLLEGGIESWNQWRDRHPDEPCDLSGLDLSEGYFFEGNFSNVSFKGANLERACFIGANLQGANLSQTNLSGAYMGDANLYGADLSEAELTGANLNRADLRQANLQKTQIDRANTYNALFSDRPAVQQPAVQQPVAEAPVAKALEKSVTESLVAAKSAITEPVALPSKAAVLASLERRTASTSVAIQERQSIREPDRHYHRADEQHSVFLNQAWWPFVWLFAAIGAVSLLLVGISLRGSDSSTLSVSQSGSQQDPTQATIPQPSADSNTAANVSQAVPPTDKSRPDKSRPDKSRPDKSRPLALSQSFDSTNEVWAIAAHNSVGGSPIVAAGNADNQVQIWNRQTGKLVRVLADHDDTVRAIAISDSGQWLVSSSGDGIRVWQPETGELIYSIPAGGSPIWSVAITPDEKYLVSSSYDGQIEVWHLDTGELYYAIETGLPVWSVAIAPDGQSFVSAGSNRLIHQWDLASGEPIKTFAGHDDAVRSVAISPDGQTLVSGSWDSTIKLWNLETGALQATLDSEKGGHGDRVISVAISPDGKTFASSSIDNTLKLWDLRNPQLIETLDRSDNWILSVAFASDGAAKQTLVSSGKDQKVNVWQ